jgi:hypothetical protein
MRPYIERGFCHEPAAQPVKTHSGAPAVEVGNCDCHGNQRQTPTKAEANFRRLQIGRPRKTTLAISRKLSLQKSQVLPIQQFDFTVKRTSW